MEVRCLMHDPRLDAHTHISDIDLHTCPVSSLGSGCSRGCVYIQHPFELSMDLLPVANYAMAEHTQYLRCNR